MAGSVITYADARRITEPSYRSSLPRNRDGGVERSGGGGRNRRTSAFVYARARARTARPQSAQKGPLSVTGTPRADRLSLGSSPGMCAEIKHRPRDNGQTRPGRGTPEGAASLRLRGILRKINAGIGREIGDERLELLDDCTHHGPPIPRAVSERMIHWVSYGNPGNVRNTSNLV